MKIINNIEYCEIRELAEIKRCNSFWRRRLLTDRMAPKPLSGIYKVRLYPFLECLDYYEKYKDAPGDCTEFNKSYFQQRNKQIDIYNDLSMKFLTGLTIPKSLKKLLKKKFKTHAETTRVFISGVYLNGDD